MSACCFDRDSSKMYIFGGWCDNWLDDFWSVDLRKVTGPPFNIVTLQPHKGTKSGYTQVNI